ncbi:unknown [Mycoplasma sp. CAG:776]|nr:unknown [Mycoplasma sp. CAG:776]
MKYIYYNQYLINRDLQNFNILVSKIKGGYLIGPKITDNFDEESFYRRVKSSALFDNINYSRRLSKKLLEKLDDYYFLLLDNEIFEITKKGKTIRHKIISLPWRSR